MYWGDVCPDGEPPVAPDSDFLLLIDPELSYMTVVWMGVDDVTVSVSGGGSARSSPSTFLMATLWPEDATLGSVAYEGWSFWMRGRFLFDVSAGSITLDPSESPQFAGSGTEDETPVLVTLDMTAGASGTISSQSQTWDLDYTSATFGWQVTLHLEGTYESLP